jgi:hypothetical protein
LRVIEKLKSQGLSNGSLRNRLGVSEMAIRLRVRFAVRPPPSISLAFPGTPPHRGTASLEAQAP